VETLIEIKKVRNKSITLEILGEILKLCKKYKVGILQSGDTIKIVKE